MTTPTGERRVEVRYRIPLPVALFLLFPEETFSVREHKAIAADISLSGCRLRVDNLDKHDYLKLLRQIRFAKVVFDFANLGMIEVRGRLVWLDYHDAKGSDIAHCHLGIHFSDPSQAFGEALASLAPSAPPAP
jgi:hypothetical protein